MSENTTTGSYQAGTTVHVAPTGLLLSRNIRDASPDPDLVRSVKAVGVLEPVTAVTTSDGGLLVRYGHRRVLAAIDAGRDTVPVYITGHDAGDPSAEVARIITQRDENTHRRGLSTAEEVGVVEQLTAFGLSPAQIAKQARLKRTQVADALTVAESTLARKATERYANLTLDQAVVVADFEDQPETVKALIVAAAENRFDHAAQRARDARAETTATAEVLALLDKAGVPLIDRPGYDDRKTLRLSRLTNDPDTRDPLTEIEHTGCPGHVAWLTTAWVRVTPAGEPVVLPDEPDSDDVAEEAWDAYEAECQRLQAASRQLQRPAAEYGCTGWARHGHHDLHASHHGGSDKPLVENMTPEQRETAKAERRLVVENNKAWQSAMTVRRDFIARFARTKTPPKGTGRFLAVALAEDPWVVGDVGGRTLAGQWLRAKGNEHGSPVLSPARSATDQRCLVVALIQVLAAYEARQIKQSWRGDGTHNATGRFLRFLSDQCGYTLSEVEQYALTDQTV